MRHKSLKISYIYLWEPSTNPDYYSWVACDVTAAILDELQQKFLTSVYCLFIQHGYHFIVFWFPREWMQPRTVTLLKHGWEESWQVSQKGGKMADLWVAWLGWTIYAPAFYHCRLSWSRSSSTRIIINWVCLMWCSLPCHKRFFGFPSLGKK